MSLIKKFFSGNQQDIRLATGELMGSIEKLFDTLAKEFNRTVAHEPLMLSTTSGGNTASGSEGSYQRLMISTSFWALSARGLNGVIEFFLMPATEIPRLDEAETASRSKLRLKFDPSTKAWTMDDIPVNDTELNTLTRSLLKDLITRSQGEYDLLPESTRLVSGGLSLTRSVRSLVAEKHELVQKVVDQQEAILNQIARDLHDAVLGNVMLLERSLSSEKSMSSDEMKTVLSEIATNLRNVCHDLYPRDLKDLGLTPLLQEMCTSFSVRTGIECQSVFVGVLPELTDEVQLHIYRIAQECFNNISKHANATLVQLELKSHMGTLTMTIRDNGKGLESAPPQPATNESSGTALPPGVTGGEPPSPIRGARGGSGSSIIKERAELIDCIYPCRIGVDSPPGQGTAVILEIVFQSI